MEKHAILKQRKELKKNSHRIVRSHYMVLFFLTLVLVLFGTEFSYIKDSWGENPITGGSSEDEDEELEKFLAYIHTVYSVFGFGLWSVVLNDGGEVIGWCGLQPIGDEASPLGRIELGYLIDRDYRGKGFGYEACRAILDLAFGKLELEEVFARIAEGNVPSVRLARSLGFVRLRGDLWVAESR